MARSSYRLTAENTVEDLAKKSYHKQQIPTSLKRRMRRNAILISELEGSDRGYLVTPGGV